MYRKQMRTAAVCGLALGAMGALFGSAALAQQASGGEGKTTFTVTTDYAFQLYGHLDLSIDDATKGIAGRNAPAGPGPAVGKLGWQPDISSNLSYFGLRGNHSLGEGNLKAVWQIETQVDVSATPGTYPTDGSQVKGAFASRNSFLGIAGDFGAVKAGKTDAPYKLSTARMDPFSATVGDYNSIMGNTGGDNRAEWDTRFSHAAWYESPKWDGFSFSALFAPGQNRADNSSGYASGEPQLCTGGNNGGNPTNCNDGSFGGAYSAAAVYSAGPLYAIAAAEVHKSVNRTTDEVANGGAAPNGAIGVVDEKAYKAGVQYKFPTNTVLNVIYERMIRNAPNPDFNERDRSGYWLALTQKLGAEDDLNLGWAHANKTPGDVGTNRADGTSAAGPVDNKANMYTVGYKHHFADKATTWYLVYARMANNNGAHYDLGASGHGITTDCHDAAGNCYAGATLQAVSVGMTHNF